MYIILICLYIINQMYPLGSDVLWTYISIYPGMYVSNIHILSYKAASLLILGHSCHILHFWTGHQTSAWFISVWILKNSSIKVHVCIPMFLLSVSHMITIYDCIFEWFALICHSRSTSFSSSSLVSYCLAQTGWSRVKSHLRCRCTVWSAWRGRAK